MTTPAVRTPRRVMIGRLPCRQCAAHIETIHDEREHHHAIVYELKRELADLRARYTLVYDELQIVRGKK